MKTNLHLSAPAWIAFWTAWALITFTTSSMLRPEINSMVSISPATLAIAAPTAFATLKNGGLTILSTPARLSGAMILPPPTSRTVMSSCDVFILKINTSAFAGIVRSHNQDKHAHLSTIPSRSFLMRNSARPTAATPTSFTFVSSPNTAFPLATAISVAVKISPP